MIAQGLPIVTGLLAVSADALMQLVGPWNRTRLHRAHAGLIGSASAIDYALFHPDPYRDGLRDGGRPRGRHVRANTTAGRAVALRTARPSVIALPRPGPVMGQPMMDRVAVAARRRCL
jgi:hypothetical protein